MLDNTLLLLGSASSSNHFSQNYPLILAGGRSMGLNGQYLRYGKQLSNPDASSRRKVKYEDLALSNLYLTMLQRLGVETESLADSKGTLADV